MAITFEFTSETPLSAEELAQIEPYSGPRLSIEGDAYRLAFERAAKVLAENPSVREVPIYRRGEDRPAYYLTRR